MAKEQQDKKAHHVVPITYLNRWADDGGRIHAFRKNDPTRPLHVLPKNIAVINEYYSQPLEGGGWDHNTLEDVFGQQIEVNWTPIIEKVQRNDVLDIPTLINLFEFMVATHVRVPAIRDAIEHALAKMVMGKFSKMKAAGAFPKPPAALWGQKFNAAIDPHQSIHAMLEIADSLGPMIDRMGYQILVNQTDLPFMTSDNPVIFFDPSLTGKKARPYRLNVGGPIELLFPMTPWHLFRGHTELKNEYDKFGPRYEDVAEHKTINRINAASMRFAYQVVFSTIENQGAQVVKFKDRSPVFDNRPIEHVGPKVITERMIFGAHRKKTKWKK